MAGQLLQGTDLILQTGMLGLDDLILQDIAVRILRRDADELVVHLQGVDVVVQFQIQFT